MKPAGETNKAGKRKGTRSVSTLTPTQLARKRANDREAQRAIRARTKEHIESLEREIEELRSHQDRDKTIQTLLRRNKTLENELRHLRESMGIRAANTSEPYHPVFHSSSPSEPHSFGQSGPSFPMMQNISSYNNMPDAAEGWPSTRPCSLPSTVSSPVSSVGTDDFGGNYIPSGAPTTVFERSSLPPNVHSPTISCVNGEATFDDTKPGFGCDPINVMPVNPTYHLQPWSMYPMPQYQPQQATLGHNSHIPQIGRCTF
ncbi:uncharacterized protein F4817DRAFT_366155 [Daldinia loculata]|uniref:uncharacterized protein n=1 Tax=Daldinia loculata TaxID=103429 RepID=UPI0020C59AA2|nr:uncharacterized protein F4817DRAFT_366155 [Daldinia loculata]KAI1646308.1 hypothetical protein F4817DRAFT_366155 [Daldinia loculata]